MALSLRGTAKSAGGEWVPKKPEESTQPLTETKNHFWIVSKKKSSLNYCNSNSFTNNTQYYVWNGLIPTGSLSHSGLESSSLPGYASVSP